MSKPERFFTGQRGRRLLMGECGRLRPGVLRSDPKREAEGKKIGVALVQLLREGGTPRAKNVSRKKPKGLKVK